MFNLYERKIEPGNEYSSTAEGSRENIHRAKARTRPYPALIQEIFSQTLYTVLRRKQSQPAPFAAKSHSF
jgi:hypothetical protein